MLKCRSELQEPDRRTNGLHTLPPLGAGTYAQSKRRSTGKPSFVQSLMEGICGVIFDFYGFCFYVHSVRCFLADRWMLNSRSLVV